VIDAPKDQNQAWPSFKGAKSLLKGVKNAAGKTLSNLPTLPAK